VLDPSTAKSRLTRHWQLVRWPYVTAQNALRVSHRTSIYVSAHLLAPSTIFQVLAEPRQDGGARNFDLPIRPCPILASRGTMLPLCRFSRSGMRLRDRLRSTIARRPRARECWMTGGAQRSSARWHEMQRMTGGSKVLTRVPIRCEARLFEKFPPHPLGFSRQSGRTGVRLVADRAGANCSDLRQLRHGEPAAAQQCDTQWKRWFSTKQPAITPTLFVGAVKEGS